MYDNNKKKNILIILLILIFYNQIIDCTIINNKTIRSNKNRIKNGQSPWHLLICLSHTQSPTKNDVQRSWEKVRMESLQNQLDVSYIEGRMTTIIDTSSYPLALINKFCNEIENGKTILNIVIGGGSAARFLITASDSINLPTLWLPMTHRDFLRQGKRGNYETRLGASSEEAGEAAAALMDKANWHAFTLLIDTTILPIKYLLKKNNRDKLTPRTIVYLPASDKSIKLRLKIISEAGGSGGVLVMACDLNNAKKILSVASKYEMLNGRFLWLWLDLKAELKTNEPGLVNTQSIQHNSLISNINNNKIYNKQEIIIDNNILKNNGKLEINDDNEHLSILSNLMHDINRLQDYKWKDKKIINKRNDNKVFIDDDNDDDDGDDNNNKYLNSKTFMPIGMLALRPSSIKLSSNSDTLLIKMLRETSQALDSTYIEYKNIIKKIHEQQLKDNFIPSCFFEGKNKYNNYIDIKNNISKILTYKLRNSIKKISNDKSEFQLLNLQAIKYPGNKTQLKWTKVGLIKGGKDVHLDTITWPGGGIVPAYLDQGGEKIGMPVYRIVTALAPPFTMVTNLLEGQCLRGLACHQSDIIKCCYGLTIDLLSYVARELNFRFDLYVSHDGLFGRRNGKNGTWNGIVGELVHGHAQLAFAPLSVSSRRAEVIDFTTPYYFGSISFLAAPKLKSEISLLAFLLPFSTNLWIAIFTSLNITAIFVAVYEWFSPFGLNPWGRQRTKNFSIASALWVMWALLCGHLVAFKAPKSWPNKFLINVWGGFSVIFVASYTANIAALIAGLVFHSGVINYQERSLFVQKVGAPSSSAVEHYVQRAHPILWSHMSRFSLSDIDEGVERLRNGTLDVLIADTPILDYYRATDDGCILQQIGDSISDDTYAVALTKGHPLKESISRVINNYSSNGLLDILQEKWYGGLPCIKGQDGLAGLDEEISGTPRPLGVASVAGVFCLLGMGVLMGTLILAGEHLFYKYTLPRLRHRPKTSIWRSRNVMFFSQKLYRFINCVELVSPHHAAKELVHTVRQGQITSLFQKSVKRKEHEQIRRRKSKAQFFEMIQEIRRVQQEEKSEIISKDVSKINHDKIKSRERSHSKSPLMPQSPKLNEKYKSTINLSSSSSSSRNNALSPINLDTSMKPREFTLSNTNLRARSPLESVGRRLSHGDGGSPPLPHTSSSSRLSISNNFGGSANLTVRPTIPIKSESLCYDLETTTTTTTTTTLSSSSRSKSPAKRGQSFPVFTTLKLPPPLTIKTSYQQQQQQSKSPLLSPNELTAAIGRKLSREWGSGTLFNISKSNDNIDTIQKFNFNDDDIAQASSIDNNTNIYQINNKDNKDNNNDDDDDDNNDIKIFKVPVRRARSHENRDNINFKTDVPSPRLAQPSVGGKFVNDKTKKQLESELKAILTARAHHRDLHPP